MTLFNNPFFLLGIGPTTHRDEVGRHIRSLFPDPAGSEDLFRDLLHPRMRLPVEISWLPGMDDHAARSWLEAIRSFPAGILWQTGRLSGLAGFNLVATALHAAGSPPSPAHLARWIVTLSRLDSRIDPDEVMDQVNQARREAGIPQVRDRDKVATLIDDVRKATADMLDALLSAMPLDDHAEVLAEVMVVPLTADDPSSCRLSRMLVDRYEARSTATADHLLASLESVIAGAGFLPRGRGGRSSWLGLLDRRFDDWLGVVRPIITIRATRGILWQPLLDLFLLLQEGGDMRPDPDLREEARLILEALLRRAAPAAIPLLQQRIVTPQESGRNR